MKINYRTKPASALLYNVRQLPMQIEQWTRKGMPEQVERAKSIAEASRRELARRKVNIDQGGGRV